ncbi:MAG: hypothetical protein VXW30_04475 [Candidatus Thermoplasmatota archaeon]|jgi:hypothetical protein|nr:hypothetical protein [Euryarchaeota archaeon]MEC7042445.1 hypothetical protein [Candidatus Thermoplasmatota archaeon]MEC7142820.1 hypothetical protein [Candidatus Thermoplasmatota archaeon]MEC7390988.1 hypothetical protein [Candidatus Thermoplasmatota archaeon]MEC7544727.1 hypothetical protein [Candidatus Thermoplasmatota archaeon]
MPGSPYIENPKNLLTWKKVLPWIVLIPLLCIGIGFAVFNSIGAVFGGTCSIILLLILSRKFSHKS